MAKYSKNQKPSEETIEAANSIAQGTKKPGQTKEQTKLISQGIQKGIDQYKKQQKVKFKEQSKKSKKLLQEKSEKIVATEAAVIYKQHWLPWAMLVVTWIAILVYFWNGSI